MTMTPHLFIARWKRSNLSEMSAYQQHFLDLCDVLGEKKPADVDPDGTWSLARFTGLSAKRS